MGWSSGSELFSSVIDAIKPEIESKETRTRIYIDLIQRFQAYDWDCVPDCLGEDQAFDDAYRELEIKDSKDKEQIEWFEEYYKEKWQLPKGAEERQK